MVNLEHEAVIRRAIDDRQAQTGRGVRYQVQNLEANRTDKGKLESERTNVLPESTTAGNAGGNDAITGRKAR